MITDKEYYQSCITRVENYAHRKPHLERVKLGFLKMELSPDKLSTTSWTELAVKHDRMYIAPSLKVLPSELLKPRRLAIKREVISVEICCLESEMWLAEDILIETIDAEVSQIKKLVDLMDKRLRLSK